jgi:hypothetical protein
MSASEQSANLLWTGGWDSTYRLLELLLKEKRSVTPFYLIDAERPSTGKELQAIKRIKERIFCDYPQTRELLQPTRYFAAADVAPDAEITDAFLAAREKNPLGIQYDWLARFCKQNGITDMQLCIIHRDGNARITFEEKISEPNAEDALSRWFSFPIYQLSKLEIAEIAANRGWGKIMHMTWFCHTPKHGKTPCGKCPPCQIVIKEGLGWRIPPRKPASLPKRFLGRIKKALNRTLYQGTAHEITNS